MFNRSVSGESLLFILVLFVAGIEWFLHTADYWIQVSDDFAISNAPSGPGKSAATFRSQPLPSTFTLSRWWQIAHSH
ncbi:MAG: hypothetical protein GX547_14450 [Phycisphaerae bacterium]|nr:hypothetical protein [Phycisphaerae bacterium]